MTFLLGKLHSWWDFEGFTPSPRCPKAGQALWAGAVESDHPSLGPRGWSILGKQHPWGPCSWMWKVRVKVKPPSTSRCSVVVSLTQSCPNLCEPKDCWSPGSNVHGIFWARILEWVAISFSRGSFQPRDWTQVSCIAGRRFYLLSHQRKPLVYPQIIKTFSCFFLGILVLGFTFRSVNHSKLLLCIFSD